MRSSLPTWEIDETKEMSKGNGVKKKLKFDFKDGDVLSLKDEGRNGVLWIGSVKFTCGGAPGALRRSVHEARPVAVCARPYDRDAFHIDLSTTISDQLYFGVFLYAFVF